MFHKAFLHCCLFKGLKRCKRYPAFTKTEDYAGGIYKKNNKAKNRKLDMKILQQNVKIKTFQSNTIQSSPIQSNPNIVFTFFLLLRTIFTHKIVFIEFRIVSWIIPAEGESKTDRPTEGASVLVNLWIQKNPFIILTYKFSSSSIAGGAVNMKSASVWGITKPSGISFLLASTWAAIGYWH